MNNKEVKHLERAALAAFRRGIGWAGFWEQHADEVRAAKPYSRERFRRLVNRLLSLVTSGDTAGMVDVANVDVLPWAQDDRPLPIRSVHKAIHNKDLRQNSYGK